jgi:tetratricopeptide (TPR) repeat protein
MQHASPTALVVLLFLGVPLWSCSDSASEWPTPTPPLTSSDPKHKQASEALAALRSAPRDEERIIWYGRRLAYIGRYEEAIDVYSRGLTIHPDSPKLLRHRGHRYITLRRFADAITDLARAGQLIDTRPDETEPDGIPNARNTPTSTLHTNIWYHLGLAHYCRGEFEPALRSYERCLAAAKNPDMEAATRYWLFLTATRLGDESRAKSALAPVRADWDIIENHVYHKMLLVFRGDLDAAEVTGVGGVTGATDMKGDAIQNKTLGYGLARHHFLSGDAKAGEAALRTIAAGSSPAFGSIAAEADLARLAGSKR